MELWRISKGNLRSYAGFGVMEDFQKEVKELRESILILIERYSIILAFQPSSRLFQPSSPGLGFFFFQYPPAFVFFVQPSGLHLESLFPQMAWVPQIWGEKNMFFTKQA